MTRGRGLRRCLRALLWLYPAEFRESLGADAVDTHVDRYRAARRSRAAVAALVAVADLLGSAPFEWVAAMRQAWPSRLRFVLRSLAHRPGIPIVVVLTLALGIGANTAIFTLVDAVLLRPLPVNDPGTLVSVYRVAAGAAGETIAPAASGVPYPVYRDLQPRIRALEALAAWHDADVAMTLGGRGSIAQVAAVSGNYFRVLGVRPVLGRAIEPRDDETPLADPVVVLSDALWARQFDRDRGVLGQTVQLGPTTFTIVGIAPPGFRGASLTRAPDAWVPMKMMQGLDLGGMFSGRFSGTLFTTFRGLGWLQLVGRLAPGVTGDAVEADLTRVLPDVEPASAPARATRMVVTPLAAGAAMTDRRALVTFIGLLGGLVTLILLLACLNAAHLLLVRGGQRARELGVCAALGAGPARLVTTLLVESALLAVAACGVGLGIGLVLLRLLAAFTLPGAIEIGSLDLVPDPRVLTFAALLSIVTVLLFGLAPAVQAARVDPVRAFRGETRGTTPVRSRGGLVAAQIAISLVILVGAGLFVRSLRAGLATDPGFDPAGIATATVELRLHGYSSGRARTFYDDVVRHVAERPGIVSAAMATSVPPSPALALPVTAVGGPAGAAPVDAVRSFITPGYFRTMGIPLLAGRDFDAGDRPGAPLAVVLNDAAARALWSDGQAVGRRVRDFGEREMTVVGVVANAVVESLADRGTPQFYYALLQETATGKTRVLARGREAGAALTAIREAIAAAGPGVAIAEAGRLRDRIDAILMPQRFGSLLLGFFGVLAGVIAAIGIYATVAAAVTARRAEIGIRLALGAARYDVFRLVAGRTGLATLGGGAAGLLAAALTSRGLERFLFATAPLDLPAFAGATAPLLALTGLAAWLAARRALRAPLVQAMRAD